MAGHGAKHLGGGLDRAAADALATFPSDEWRIAFEWRHARAFKLQVFSSSRVNQLFAIEPFRERTFAHPLLFCRNSLANFAVTRATARPTDAASWMHAVAVLTGTYLSEIELSAEELRQVWENARKRSRSTHVLFACAAHFAACRDDSLRNRERLDVVLAYFYGTRFACTAFCGFSGEKAEEEFLRFIRDAVKPNLRHPLSRAALKYRRERHVW